MRKNKIRNVLVFGMIFILMTTMIVNIIPEKGSAGSYPSGPPFPNHEVDNTRLITDPWYTSANHHRTITAALVTASSGDWIYVWKGTYNESITINKKLKLEGEVKTQTIIQGGSGGDVVTITVDDVTMKDFTVNSSETYLGVHLKGSVSNEVTDCDITDNIINTNFRAIGLDYANSNVIINNTCSNANIGLIMSNADSNTIINNSLINNNYSIEMINSNNNKISENNCSNNNNDGILISGVSPSSDNNIITNNILNSNIRGIHNAGNSNTLIDNILSSNKVGIRLFWSKNNIIYNNTMLLNGIYIKGNSLEYWNTHTITTNNTVNGNPVYYWKNQTSGNIPSGAGQVILGNCTNIKITNQNLNNGTVGILLGYSSHCLIDNNSCDSNNYYGISYEEDNDYNIIYNNSIKSNEKEGIYYYNDNDYNVIINNSIESNKCGIYLRSSDSNHIKNNYIYSNNNYGIDSLNSDSNLIYHNNFIKNNYNDGTQTYNGPQASEEGGTSEWDNDYPIGGNYWDDFNSTIGTPYDGYRGPNQNLNFGKIGDGIIDQSTGGLNSYTITGGSEDEYPLFKPIINDRVQRPPFRINSNSGFNESNGVISGDGSQTSPWIISGWHINGSDFGNCIYIGNTTEYFIIQDCYVFNASGGTWCPWYQNAGITLYHVENGKITSKEWNIGDPHELIIGYIIAKPTISTLNKVDGIMLHGDWINGSATRYNTISNCIITNNGECGIMLNQDIHHNTITNNIISYNEYGIRNLFAAYSNSMYENIIRDNEKYGIIIEDNTSSNNDIYQNNFIDNNNEDVQAYDDCLIQGQNNNRWDDSCSYGNYWSDYESRYPDANNDGDVWDTEYDINPNWANHKDNYPLVDKVD